MLQYQEISTNEKTEKLLILLSGAGEDKEKILAKLTAACTVVAVTSDDWNGDYSPWAAQDFAGHGAQSLRWLQNELLPRYRSRQCYLAGYSLAGLFALWAFYQENMLAGTACVSGSLWYPGWAQYQKPVRQQPGRVYLSLGGKEANSANPLLAGVGKAFQVQYEACKHDSMITAVHYDLNPGGHFAKVEERIAKGVNWLCSQNLPGSCS